MLAHLYSLGTRVVDCNRPFLGFLGVQSIREGFNSSTAYRYKHNLISLVKFAISVVFVVVLTVMQMLPIASSTLLSESKILSLSIIFHTYETVHLVYALSLLRIPSPYPNPNLLNPNHIYA